MTVTLTEQKTTKSPKYDTWEMPVTLGNDWATVRPISEFKSKQIDHDASIETDDGWVNVEAGQFILVSNTGEVLAMDEGEYNEKLTNVPPSKQDTHFGQTP